MTEISTEFLERFYALRGDLFDAIRFALSIDSHCKPYEGTFSLIFPNYFEEEFCIKLDCYVIGPSRGFSWYGNSFEECLDAAEPIIRSWIKESFDD